MRTYDTKAGTHGTAPFWKSLRALALRWIDREREIVSLRNAVGMMSEARRADAAEYHLMQSANRRITERARAADELLNEVRSNCTRDDDFPGDLLPRIDEHMNKA